MSNYEQKFNRYTAVFLEAEDGTYTRQPFDIVKFNVDVDSNPKRELVPCGSDEGKVFEKIWVVKVVPWKKKVSFSGLH